MKNFMNHTRSIITVIITFALLSTTLIAQDGSKKAKEEMKSGFGTVPAMMKVYPEKMLASAWEWFKATQSPDGAIPSKYSELISLGVASQIPCSYCVYAHTTQAKMLGATEAEIKAAVASAAVTRHWSTVLNGSDVTLDEFKKEWDGILAYVKKQSEKK